MAKCEDGAQNGDEEDILWASSRRSQQFSFVAMPCSSGFSFPCFRWFLSDRCLRRFLSLPPFSPMYSHGISLPCKPSFRTPTRMHRARPACRRKFQVAMIQRKQHFHVTFFLSLVVTLTSYVYVSTLTRWFVNSSHRQIEWMFMMLSQWNAPADMMWNEIVWLFQVSVFRIFSSTKPTAPTKRTPLLTRRSRDTILSISTTLSTEEDKILSFIFFLATGQTSVAIQALLPPSLEQSKPLALLASHATHEADGPLVCCKSRRSFVSRNNGLLWRIANLQVV